MSSEVYCAAWPCSGRRRETGARSSPGLDPSKRGGGQETYSRASVRLLRASEARQMVVSRSPDRHLRQDLLPVIGSRGISRSVFLSGLPSLLSAQGNRHKAFNGVDLGVVLGRTCTKHHGTRV